MNFKLWRDMLSEAVWWEKFDDDKAYAVYQRTVVISGTGQTYHAQGAGQQVDLTKLYEQCKMLSILKDGANEKEISSSDC